jgi:hypothetical protein
VSCETLEHVPYPRRAVAELARVLRPTGTLLLTTPNYLSLTGLHRLYCIAIRRGWDEGGQPLAHWTALPRTWRWLQGCGLSVRSVDGDGWIVPIPGRVGGHPLTPPRWTRRALVPFALHQVLEARHRSG